MNKGQPLEITVEEILKDQGYQITARNKRVYRPVNAEIDIVCRDPFGKEIFVECKSRQKHKVNLEEYAKFYKIVDSLCPRAFVGYRAIMVTDNYFVNRVHQFARQDKILLIDRNGLEHIKQDSRKGLKGVVIPILNGKEQYDSKGLSGLLEYLLKRALNVDDHIRYNRKAEKKP